MCWFRADPARCGAAWRDLVWCGVTWWCGDRLEPHGGCAGGVRRQGAHTLLNKKESMHMCIIFFSRENVRILVSQVRNICVFSLFSFEREKIRV